MRVSELKALARECGLRGYSQMRKAEIIELIRNNQQGWARDIPLRNGTTPLGGAQAPWVQRTWVANDPKLVHSAGPPAPPPPMQPNQTQSVRFRPDHPRQPRQPPWSGGPRVPTQQEMDIFEQQEMSKS